MGYLQDFQTRINDLKVKKSKALDTKFFNLKARLTSLEMFPMSESAHINAMKAEKYLTQELESLEGKVLKDVVVTTKEESTDEVRIENIANRKAQKIREIANQNRQHAERIAQLESDVESCDAKISGTSRIFYNDMVEKYLELANLA